MKTSGATALQIVGLVAGVGTGDIAAQRTARRGFA